MFVVATAGHVDHGKSTLVKALTTMEPDRWEEEKERGLTIDLGFVWTTLPSGRGVAFVDVPGHEKFLGNMLAGLGPVQIVCFIVAADEGWQAQSTDHRDVIRALNIRHGVVALTRADRADADRRAEVTSQVRNELAATGLADAPIVPVSGITGEGLDKLLDALDSAFAAAPQPDAEARVRMWIDRAFTIKGAGTVVTGTLAAGTLTEGDQLNLVSSHGKREATVRSIQSQDNPHESIGPANRVAVNLRSESADQIHRGDALLTPGAWPVVDTVDIRRSMGRSFDDAPKQVVVHLGTAEVQAGLRPFGPEHARLTLQRHLPMVVGDELVLRAPGARSVLAGAKVLDVDPPELKRRGAGRRRTEALEGMDSRGDITTEVTRRKAMRREDLVRMGIETPETPPKGIVAFRGWWVAAPEVLAWREQLVDALDRQTERDPLSPGLTRGAALGVLDLPGEALLDVVVAAAKLEQTDGVLRRPGQTVDLGEAEQPVRALEARLKGTPFVAPDANDLAELGLGTRQLAAAERAGRLLRIADGIVLLPEAPKRAVAALRELEQPFTTSQARKALGTTRRVAIPLLEHLDSTGKTRRVDASNRIVV